MLLDFIQKVLLGMLLGDLCVAAPAVGAHLTQIEGTPEPADLWLNCLLVSLFEI
jgi:hypothetical protein